MCGIFVILGREPVADHLLQALRRLEYRSYDSAGIATIEDGTLCHRRVEGKLAALEGLLCLGRGTSYPTALEGALKLKEVSYIHAESYAAGERKHGPLALIDDSVPVIVNSLYSQVFEKIASNMQEVSARGGAIERLSRQQSPGTSMSTNLVT